MEECRSLGDKAVYWRELAFEGSTMNSSPGMESDCPKGGPTRDLVGGLVPWQRERTFELSESTQVLLGNESSVSRVILGRKRISRFEEAALESARSVKFEFMRQEKSWPLTQRSPERVLLERAWSC